MIVLLRSQPHLSNVSLRWIGKSREVLAWKKPIFVPALIGVGEYIIDMNQTIDEIPFELNLTEAA